MFNAKAYKKLHFKCNDNLATTAVLDYSGEGLNGTASVNTDVINASGKINDAFHLDGTSHNINIDNFIAARSSDTKGTFMCWIYRDDTDIGTIIGIGDNSDATTYFTLIANSTTLYATFDVGGTRQWSMNSSSSTIPELAWTHIAIVHDGVTPLFYVNGVLISHTLSNWTDTTAWMSSLTGADEARIGARILGGSLTYYFDGLIDDVRYYDEALDENNISEVYSDGYGTEDDAANVVSSYQIEHRNKAGELLRYLTDNVDKLSWAWNHYGGCGRCSMTLNIPYRDVEFESLDDIQIRIKSGTTSKLVYRGWVSAITPISQSGKDIIKLDVKGYFDLLKYIIIQDSGEIKSYTSEKISDIVDDIIDTFVVANSDILKGTIEESTFTADYLEFKKSVSSALKTLADIEGNIEYGVDENLRFFWYAESDDVAKKFFIGDNIEKVERKIDYAKLVNKIYFEGGDVADVKYSTIATSSSSISSYFLAEKVITNTSITTSSVANQYLSALLSLNDQPKYMVKIKIPDTTLRLEDTLPMGKISLYDPAYDKGAASAGVWGVVSPSGGSGWLWGRTTSGGDNKIWGGGSGAYQDQVETIQYALSQTDECFNIEIKTGVSSSDTSWRIKQLELLIDDIRQVR